MKGAIKDERTDYENYIDYLRKHRMIKPPLESEIVHYMSVVPVSFSKWGPSMLSSLHTVLQGHDLVIHPRFTTLIAQLQSARNMPNRNSGFVLDKTQNSMDALDALRLSLWNLDVGAPTEFEPVREEGEGEEQGEQENVILSS